MKTLQKAGGIAALAEALAYIIGFAMMATVLNPGDTAGWNAERKLSFLLDRKLAFQIWMLFIYVAGGAGLAVLAVALHERLKDGFPGAMQIATAFGLIWAGLVIASGMIANTGLDTVAALYPQDAARATTAWIAIGAVQNGLGGGVEVVGGLWVLLISVIALRSAALPKALNVIGLVVGTSGVLSALPSLGGLGTIFGLTQIVWFAYLGYWMLRRPQ